MRKILLFAAALSLMAMPLSAGSQADKAHMEAMKAEFGKCMMCKNMVAVMDELMPVMDGEVVKLSNGMAMMHTVSDPTKVKLLHDADAKMAAAGEACMKLTDAEAKEQLCTLCQDIRGLVKAGATMSKGTTKNGDLMVLTSNDPVLQKQIAGFQAKCEMMTASH